MTSGWTYQPDSICAPIYSQMPTLLHKSCITLFPYSFLLFTYPSSSHSIHTIRPLFLAVWQVTAEKSHKPALKGKFVSFDGEVFAALLRIFNDFRAVIYKSINYDMHDNFRNVINIMRMVSLFVKQGT